MFYMAYAIQKASLGTLSKKKCEPDQTTNSIPSLDWSEESLLILWSQTVHYRIYNSLPLLRVRGIQPSPSVSAYFFKINFNLILPSTPRYSK